MSRTFTGHSPKPARVIRAGTAPRQTAQAASPASTPRPTSTGKPTGERTGTAPGQSTGEPATGEPTGRPKEIGGPSGPEPTRYGDWERNGICVDF